VIQNSPVLLSPVLLMVTGIIFAVLGMAEITHSRYPDGLGKIAQPAVLIMAAFTLIVILISIKLVFKKLGWQKGGLGCYTIPHILHNTFGWSCLPAGGMPPGSPSIGSPGGPMIIATPGIPQIIMQPTPVKGEDTLSPMGPGGPNSHIFRDAVNANEKFTAGHVSHWENLVPSAGDFMVSVHERMNGSSRPSTPDNSPDHPMDGGIAVQVNSLHDDMPSFHDSSGVGRASSCMSFWGDSGSCGWHAKDPSEAYNIPSEEYDSNATATFVTTTAPM